MMIFRLLSWRKQPVLPISLLFTIGSPLLLNWMTNKNEVYPLVFTFILAMIFGYILLCCFLDPLKIFIGSSILFMMLGTKIIMDPTADYIGGVGAGQFYIGTPHLSVFFGLLSLFIFKLKNPKTFTFKIGKLESAVIIFTCLATAAAIIAPYKAASNVEINLYLTMMILFIIWTTIFRNLENQSITNLVLKTLFANVIIQLVICILQILKGNSLGLGFLGEGTVGEREGVDYSYVTGTFIHPGPLSVFFMVCLSFFFPFVLQAQKRSSITVWGFVLSLVGLILTFSRTSLAIATGILVVEMIWLSASTIKLSKKRILFFLMIVIGTLFIFGSSISSRFQSLTSNTDDDQIVHRLDHDKLAWEYIQLKPILGYGLNNWSFITHKTPILTTISGKNIDFYYDNPVHNIYLYLWFEGGILLLIGFLFFVGYAIQILIKKIKKGDGLELGALASIMGILIYGMTGWGLFNGSQLLYILFFVVCFSKISPARSE